MTDQQPRGPILLIATDGDSTRAIYHALAASFDEVRVILEEPISRLHLARRRVSNVGLIPTLGQVLFSFLVVPILTRLSIARIREIQKMYDLDYSPLGAGDVQRVRSANEEETRQTIRTIRPGVVVINGTRIIGEKTLNSISVHAINCHAGITPLYRGVHGGYWALAEGRADLVGSTVHLVDKGIDTGSVIEQVHFSVSRRDNFATYPHLHTAASIPVLLEAVHDALQGSVATRPSRELPSRLRYHPTLWGYVAKRISQHVR